MALKALRSFISKVYNLCINQYYWTDLHFSFILGSFSDLISLQMTSIMVRKAFLPRNIFDSQLECS